MAPAHCGGLYALDDEARQAGEMEIETCLRVLGRCYEKDEWPGRDPGINEASLPMWALKQLSAIL